MLLFMSIVVVPFKKSSIIVTIVDSDEIALTDLIISRVPSIAHGLNERKNDPESKKVGTVVHITIQFNLLFVTSTKPRSSPRKVALILTTRPNPFCELLIELRHFLLSNVFKRF